MKVYTRRTVYKATCAICNKAIKRNQPRTYIVASVYTRIAHPECVQAGLKEEEISADN